MDKIAIPFSESLTWTEGNPATEHTIGTVVVAGVKGVIVLEVSETGNQGDLTDFKLDIRPHIDGNWYTIQSSGTGAWVADSKKIFGLVYTSTTLHNLTKNTAGAAIFRFHAADAIRFVAKGTATKVETLTVRGLVI